MNLLAVAAAYPSTQTLDIASQTTNISPVQNIGNLIELGTGLILVIAALAVLYFLIMGGFNWLTAGGDKSKVESGRNMIINAIIGLTIMASTFAIYRIIIDVFGLQSDINIIGGSSSSSGSSDSCSDWCAGADQCYASGGTKVSKMCSYDGCSDPNTFPCKVN